jgi:hypothetical protein
MKSCATGELKLELLLLSGDSSTAGTACLINCRVLGKNEGSGGHIRFVVPGLVIGNGEVQLKLRQDALVLRLGVFNVPR